MFGFCESGPHIRYAPDGVRVGARQHTDHMTSRVLVTGSTGYVGGRLVPRLLKAGYTVRVLVRSPQRLSGVPWHDQVEIVQGDLGDAESVERACQDVETLYYLVHSMSSGAAFEQTESDMARTVAAATARAGVQRIVYLGGLHPEGVKLSQHMRSRTAVGDILLQGEVPAVVFEAGVVIGSGSASFEMIRHLTENLPVMPAPSWVLRKIEPIAVRDLLHYLVHAPELPAGLNRRFGLGSREVLTYGAIMYGYAHEAHLNQRYIYALPIPAPTLAGWWVALTTPIPHPLAVPLVQSLQHDAVTTEHDIDGYIPPPEGGLTGYRRAAQLALGKIAAEDVETTWASAANTPPSDPLPSDPDWSGRATYVDERHRWGAASPDAVWEVIQSVGADNGWYSWGLAWSVRGVMDKLAGGVGLTRGRRHRQRLAVGDAVDWWRVEAITNTDDGGRTLLLHAEMKAPGQAWLEMSAVPKDGGTEYRQRAIYFPRGILGKSYWWGVYPFHGFIFPSMARNILAAAERKSTGTGQVSGPTDAS